MFRPLLSTSCILDDAIGIVVQVLGSGITDASYFPDDLVMPHVKPPSVAPVCR